MPAQALKYTFRALTRKPDLQVRGGLRGLTLEPRGSVAYVCTTDWERPCRLNCGKTLTWTGSSGMRQGWADVSVCLGRTGASLLGLHSHAS